MIIEPLPAPDRCVNCGEVSAMREMISEVLGYPPELRCRCETRFDQCVRQSTENDGYCNGCRDVRPNGGSREHVIVLIEHDRVASFAATPTTSWSDAHYSVVTAEQMAIAEDLRWMT
ncbi:hypothetical protein ACFWYW_55730 [Nonomuraea sp. NPDC059023]|uniref:hypothetical protein n=1 Tax=unclassified Nonomuraea TaxID=2593643 RepID=UPI00369F4EFB